MMQPEHLMPELHNNSIFVTKRMRSCHTRNSCEEKQA